MSLKTIPVWLLLAALMACNSLHRTITRTIERSPAFADSFTGFVLFDPETNKTLYDHLGSKYFTPASNTKLFTFYAANRILGDSIPAFRYLLKEDSLWIWGTGDPGFLHPELPVSEVFHFLKGKKITLVSDPHLEPVYGPGWAWDDFQGSYQREKSAFPIYGNAVRLQWDSLQGQLLVHPPFFRDSVFTAYASDGPLRLIGQNRFFYYYPHRQQPIDIPIRFHTQLIGNLLQDTLKVPVAWKAYHDPQGSSLFYSIPTDSVLQPMLQDSDNFLAEQLILLCSSQLIGELNSARTIQLLTDSLLADLPQKPLWVDGSGLSRYNLFTPQTIVALLYKIYREIPEHRLFELFPAGGQSGTIKDYYQAEEPYIFAKTGTLSNNHALSGYLITKKGKRLIFSFMHNHYINGSLPIKHQMEQMLWQIHLNN